MANANEVWMRYFNYLKKELTFPRKTGNERTFLKTNEQLSKQKNRKISLLKWKHKELTLILSNFKTKHITRHCNILEKRSTRTLKIVQRTINLLLTNIGKRRNFLEPVWGLLDLKPLFLRNNKVLFYQYFHLTISANDYSHFSFMVTNSKKNSTSRIIYNQQAVIEELVNY